MSKEQVDEPRRYSFKEILDSRNEAVYSIHYDGFDRYYMVLYVDVEDSSKMKAVLISPYGYLLDPIENWHHRGYIFTRTDKSVTTVDRT